MTKVEDTPPQGGLLPARSGLIVCETDGHWAAAMRRDTLPRGLHVYETRSLAQCWELLARLPESFVVVELDPAWSNPLMRRMTWLGRDYPRAKLAVVADRRLAACEWLLREAGAVWFACSMRECRGIVDMAARHLASVPQPSLGIAERVWTELPWGPGGGV
jgi:hypothetical protein